MPDHTEPRSPTGADDVDMGGRGRTSRRARRQAARGRRWTWRSADAPDRPHPAGSQTRGQSKTSAEGSQTCGTGSGMQRLRVGDPRRAAPLPRLPRHREHHQTTRPPGREHTRAADHREASIRTSRGPSAYRCGSTRAMGSSPPGHRYGIHGPLVGVPAPHPPSLGRSDTRPPRRRHWPLPRLLRPDPRRPACAARPTLGCASTRRAPKSKPRYGSGSTGAGLSCGRSAAC